MTRPEKRRSPRQKKVIVTDSPSITASSKIKDDMRSKEATTEKKAFAAKCPSTLTNKETDNRDETLANTIHSMRAATKSTKKRPAIKKKTVATTKRIKALVLVETPDPASVHGDHDIKPEKSPSPNIPMERKPRPIPITQRLDDPEPSLEDAFDAIDFVEDMANTVREIVNRSIRSTVAMLGPSSTRDSGNKPGRTEDKRHISFAKDETGLLPILLACIFHYGLMHLDSLLIRRCFFCNWCLASNSSLSHRRVTAAILHKAHGP